jgi:hypothetical protein
VGLVRARTVVRIRTAGAHEARPYI